MKQLLFAFLVILLDVMSCGPRPEPDYVEVKPTSIVLESHEGASATFQVSSNTEWSIGIGLWGLEFSPSSGEGDAVITVKALSSNDNFYDRSVVILVSGRQTVAAEILVTQKGKPSADTRR